MKEKKRVIFAISSSIAGGAQIYLFNIIEYIKDDYSVMVLCPKGFFFDKVKTLADVGLKEQEIGYKTKAELRSLLISEKEKYGEVFVNAHLLGTGLWICRAMQDLENVYLSVTVHNKVIYDNISLPRKILYPLFIKYMSRYVGGFISVSQEIADSVKMYSGKECEYIPSSVPLKYSPKDTSLYSPDNDKIKVGFVGRVSPQKNPVRFVDTTEIICRKMSNVEIVVVGDGELMPAMRQRVEEKGLKEKYVFKGFMSQPADEMRKLDVLMMTSDYEGTPMVLLEAMSYGVPIVSTKVGGIPTVIENWQDGVLADDFSPETIANDVVSLLKSKEKYVAISKAAYEKIKTKFSYKSNIERYMKIVCSKNRT